MLALADYGLLLLFFLGVLVLILLIARPSADEIAAQKNVTPSQVNGGAVQKSTTPALIPTVEHKKLSYVIILVFLLLLVLSTIISAKGESQPPAHS